MNIIKDIEYNARYPDRPKRYIRKDEGSEVTFFTEDAIAPTIAANEKRAADWREIQEIVRNMNK